MLFPSLKKKQRTKPSKNYPRTKSNVNVKLMELENALSFLFKKKSKITRQVNKEEGGRGQRAQ